MKRLSDEFVGLMRDLDWKLDYSEESVQTLEEMIEQQFGDWRPWRRGKVAEKNLPVASLVGLPRRGNNPPLRRPLGLDAGL
jgi:hypothetical protein